MMELRFSNANTGSTMIKTRRVVDRKNESSAGIVERASCCVAECQDLS